MISKFSKPEFFYGVVESREDPLLLGRVKVRVLGVHTEDTTVLPVGDLPWAIPASSVDSASMNGIGKTPLGVVEGSWIIGFSRDGEMMNDLVYFATLGGIASPSDLGGEGFADPNSVYPKEDFIGEPDTNRLARNEKIDDTVVKAKKDSAVLDIWSALTQYSEPETPYNAEYPFNHVSESESGHIVELDDTKDSERIHVFHRAGTFYEIHPSGLIVRKNADSKFELTMSDEHVFVNGSQYVTAQRNREVYVVGNEDVRIDGNQSVKIHGNAELYIDGNYKTKVNGDYSLEVMGDYEKRVNGNENIDTCGNRADSVGMDVDTNIVGNSLLSVGEGCSISAEDVSISALNSAEMGGDTANVYGSTGATLTGMGGASVYSGGPVGIVGSIVGLNSGGVGGTRPIHYPPNETIEKAVPADFVDRDDLRRALLNASDTEFPHVYDETSYPVDILAERGVTDFDAETTDTFDATPSDVERIIPETEWDSTRFTLAQMSSNAVVSKYVVRAQRGLSEEEIISNLNYLTVNIMDRVQARYPDVIVTSGFRAGSAGSKHELGIAVDIQVPGNTNKDYYDMAIWMSQNLNIDAMLLEFKNTGTGNGWIHVSYNKTGNRGIFQTYFNNRKHSNGLVLLS